MIFLLLFAFLGGLVTVLSPCILPLLPIILSSSAGDKSKPFGVVVGFVASFTFFTLFLTAIVRATGIPSDSLRFISIIIIGFFGLVLVIPRLQLAVEQIFVKVTRFSPRRADKAGFGNGLIIGLSLGLLWTPCVGPILAGVISLALSGSVTTDAFFITLAYSLGTAIPMFIIMRAGNTALTRVPWLVRNTDKIQRLFGVLMILTAYAIYANIDRRFQSYILDKFPQYGVGLTSLEDNQFVQEALKGLRGEQNALDNMVKSQTQAPEIIPGGEWLNSGPLKISELRGKVVLVDFWTYSCINCIRTLPYLRDWWQKYEDDGLVIIGVHTPEFEFEKNINNLEKAVSDFELKYPIMQDNDYATWRAYNNHYWPAKYLIDKDGFIRYYHFGEGKYDETERMIQRLLAETGMEVSEQINTETYSVTPNATPETYLGYQGMEGFVSPEKLVKDEFSNYSIPESFETLDTFAFEGTWKITPEFATPKAGGKLVFVYRARDVFLVMNSDSPTRVRIYLDGELKNTITVDQDKLYELVNLEKPGDHILMLEFLDEGTEIFAFTFG